MYNIFTSEIVNVDLSSSESDRIMDDEFGIMNDEIPNEVKVLLFFELVDIC